MKKILCLILLMMSAVASAQRFDIISGGLENLGGIKEYNVTFDYTNIEVNGFESESAFLTDKMKKRENREGKAEEFKEDWFANREKMYEPAFIDYFNKMFKDGEAKIGKNPDAKYTMDVKSTWVYPGYNAGTDVQPAKLSAVITIKETANPSKTLLVIEFEKVIGIKHGLGNTLGDRISGAYEKLAKNFTLQIKRFI
jgi:hypothetical protein